MARDMSLGDRVNAGDVILSEVPVEVVPRDAITATDTVIGKILKADVVQGEMLLSHNVADPTNNNHDLSFILADDHVMMAFPATDQMSKENVIQRGDVIDIFATFQEQVKQVPGVTESTTTTNQEPVMRVFTVDTFQKVSVTALVLDVINQEQATPAGVNLTGAGNTTATSRTTTEISSYLLALTPQDALILKHLKDVNATFDFVLRSPTSTVQYDLTPVTEEYIIELYGLEILP